MIDRDFIVFKSEVIAREIKNGSLRCYGSTGISTTINFLHSHIRKTCEKVFGQVTERTIV